MLLNDLHRMAEPVSYYTASLFARVSARVALDSQSFLLEEQQADGKAGLSKNKTRTYERALTIVK